MTEKNELFEVFENSIFLDDETSNDSEIQMQTFIYKDHKVEMTEDFEISMTDNDFDHKTMKEKDTKIFGLI